MSAWDTAKRSSTGVGGSLLGGAAMGPTGALGGALAGYASGSFNPAHWGGTLNKLDPKSNFQAQTPEMINQQNFTQALANAQGNAGMFFNPSMAGHEGGKSFAEQLMDQSRTGMQQQQQYINSLRDQAAGQGPGQQLAQNMMNQGMQQNAMGALGMAASQKGINPAMAARMASQQASQGNQAAAQAATNFGLQQQMAAQQQLGGALSGQNNMLANQLQGIGGLAQQQFGTLQGANTAQNQLGVQASLGSQGLNQATMASNAANRARLEGGILQGVAGAISKPAMGGAAHGGIIAGQAPYNGDDARNDEVPAMLSKGEIVVPRSAASDREKAIAFLDALKEGDSGWRSKKKKKDKQ